MKCLRHVLNAIGVLLIGLLTVCTVTSVAAICAVSIQKFFAWPEPAGFGIFCGLMLIAIGTAIGVMDCKTS